MDPLTRPASDPDRRHLAYLLTVLLAMGALLWSFAGEDPWGWLLPEYVVIEIDRGFYRVPERRLKTLSDSRPDWLSLAEVQMLERIEQGIERDLARLFGEIHGRIPVFADWYYSMGGVSLRLLAAIPNPFWGGRETVMGRELAARLFPEDVWAGGLAELERSVAERHTQELSALEDRWLAWFARELTSYRQDGPPAEGREVVRVGRNLHTHLADVLEGDRIAIQSVAGVGSGALLARAAVARVNAATAGGRAAARLAARGAAGSGTVACGLSGPLAVGCAVVVFAGITFGTEWALLQADEALNREDLEQALHDSVDALHEAMSDEYASRLLAAFEKDVKILGAGIRASLRPVDRLTASAGR
jgi:hypothetical protein